MGLWYQLYTTNNWDVTRKLLNRAEAAGCPVVAVTVDFPAGRNTETDQREACLRVAFAYLTSRRSVAAHRSSRATMARREWTPSFENTFSA